MTWGSEQAMNISQKAIELLVVKNSANTKNAV